MHFKSLLVVTLFAILGSLRFATGRATLLDKTVMLPIIHAPPQGPSGPAPRPSPTSQPTSQPPSDAQTQFEQQVIVLVNQERATNGLPALAFNVAIGNAARGHSDDMARNNFFSHTGSNGSNPGTRLTAAGYNWSFYAENIAAGYQTPADVVKGWMSSPGHRANILARSAREIGAGYVERAGTAYGKYWTLNFGAPR
jgi:uncharacterized protein YkwD